MVSFDELNKFLAFLVLNKKGRALISNDFRNANNRIPFPEKSIGKFVEAAIEISKSLNSGSQPSEGEIFTITFSSIKLSVIKRDYFFILISTASTSSLDVEVKLRTLMSLFLGAFSQELYSTKRVKLSETNKELFEEQLKTVMAGESRYMGSSMKSLVSSEMKKWIKASKGIRGASITSYSGEVIVNHMSEELLPSAIRAISAAFSALLQGPKFFLTAASDTNLFVNIIGEGLLLLVDGDPTIPPQDLIPEIEKMEEKLKQTFMMIS